MLEPMISVMETYSTLGTSELPNGVKLIGKCEDKGPLAYIHSIFPGLNEDELIKIEHEAGRKLPKDLREMYIEANGLKYFFDTFTIYGLRSGAGRAVDTSRQPYSIQLPNVEERPSDAPENAFFFGNYDWDGSLLYMTENDSRVFFCSRDTSTPLMHWNNLEEMISLEATRIKKLYDSKGREIDSRVSTLPI